MSALDGLPAPGHAVQGVIDGAAGHIECVVAMPRAAPRGIAVICHPHPLYGGALSNKVTYTLASAALAFGLAAVRFNFRGVGKSQGGHDSARGETDDCVTVVDWLRTQRRDAPLLLAGFSFGAFVSLNAAARVRPAALVSIAPPFGRYFGDAPKPLHPGCPWITLHSRDDEVVPFDESRETLDTYDPAPEQVLVDGAGHFFHGRLDDVRDTVLPFLAREWPASGED
ncbi:MAG: alpha/beta hydrolase [Panacagrimonas sp.]